MKKHLNSIIKLLLGRNLTNYYIILLCLLIIFFLTFNLTREFIPQLYSDSAIYAHLTWFFTQGDIHRAVHMWWQPLYPFFASILFNYLHDIPQSLFYVSVLSGVFLFIPIFVITYEITKKRYISIFAGFLAAFSPQLVKSYYNLLTENLFITLLMFSIMFAILTISRNKILYAFIYGLTIGVTYIARGDALLSFQLFLLFSFLLMLFKKIKKSFYAKIFVVSVLGFFIAASPYLYFNYQKFGFLHLGAKFNAVKNMPAYFAPQRNLTSTYAQDVWVLDEPNYDSHFFHKPYDYYKNREELIRDGITRFWRYISLFQENENILVIYSVILGFILSAVYFFRNFKAGLFLNFLALLGFLGSLFFQPSADFRYAFWLYPLFSIFIAMMVFILNNSVMKIGLSRLLMVAVIILINIIIVSFYFNVYKNSLVFLSSPESGSEVRMLAGEYIANLKPHARIMTRREVITYYAKGSIIYIPSSIDIKDLERYAKLYKTDYIVADRETFPKDTLLNSLVDEKQPPDWLKPLKIWDQGYPKTIIYEVKY